MVGRGDLLYEKDGEKYFVVDGHVHYWDASPGNWIEGQEEYAKGWIECFYGYHKLGPEEYYWPMEKFQKYSEGFPVGSDAYGQGRTGRGPRRSCKLRRPAGAAAGVSRRGRLTSALSAAAGTRGR